MNKHPQLFELIEGLFHIFVAPMMQSPGSQGFLGDLAQTLSSLFLTPNEPNVLYPNVLG